MKRTIITTADGSKTIQIEDWNEQYHSKHGAVQEAYHVFIDNGLIKFNSGKVSILEIGFGTGLNALITLAEAKKRSLTISYTAVEAFPVSSHEIEALNYIDALDMQALRDVFLKMHSCSWETPHGITEDFTITKQQKDFGAISDKKLFNLIYFDAFGPRVQPELWTVSIFQKMYDALISRGILVTYSAKGSVRRAMLEVGFEVERLPGPPGKREMLRATKP